MRGRVHHCSSAETVPISARLGKGAKTGLSTKGSDLRVFFLFLPCRKVLSRAESLSVVDTLLPSLPLPESFIQSDPDGRD